jgi:hypothetical protein
LKDIPLVPPIMGQQILASLNMWMGNSRDGASSGLHHDYHDNLYVLLRGSKHFQVPLVTLAARLLLRSILSPISQHECRDKCR